MSLPIIVEMMVHGFWCPSPTVARSSCKNLKTQLKAYLNFLSKFESQPLIHPIEGHKIIRVPGHSGQLLTIIDHDVLRDPSLPTNPSTSAQLSTMCEKARINIFSDLLVRKRLASLW